MSLLQFPSNDITTAVVVRFAIKRLPLGQDLSEEILDTLTEIVRSAVARKDFVLTEPTDPENQITPESYVDAVFPQIYSVVSAVDSKQILPKETLLRDVADALQRCIVELTSIYHIPESQVQLRLSRRLQEQLAQNRGNTES